MEYMGNESYWDKKFENRGVNPLKPEEALVDNIIINHYRLSKEKLSSINKHLRIECVLFISGFGQKHVPDSKIREEDLIQPSDFDGLNESLELVKYNETIDERGSFVTYIYRNQGDLDN